MRYKVEYQFKNDECSTELVVFRDGEEILREADSGEPEDNSYHRDWCWVADALRQAYQMGFEDGKGERNE